MIVEHCALLIVWSFKIWNIQIGNRITYNKDILVILRKESEVNTLRLLRPMQSSIPIMFINYYHNIIPEYRLFSVSHISCLWSVNRDLLLTLDPVSLRCLESHMLLMLLVDRDHNRITNISKFTNIVFKICTKIKLNLFHMVKMYWKYQKRSHCI